MNVRIAFLLREPDGRVIMDGCQIDESFDISILPKIDEHVILPKPLIDTLEEQCPSDVGIKPRRFQVHAIDHHWDRIGQHVSVYLIDVPFVRRIKKQ